ncbi:hypothetical protein C8Q74DRAFT_1295630 [Fomes fomentarius]|nr:hypothetical protein C8Q74DRAFT_1295630 [Fomes fomentarius]
MKMGSTDVSSFCTVSVGASAGEQPQHNVCGSAAACCSHEETLFTAAWWRGWPPWALSSKCERPTAREDEWGSKEGHHAATRYRMTLR